MSGLARCVGDVEPFLSRHWAAAPLLHQAADPGGFADLFTLGDVDDLVSGSFLRLPTFRLVRDGVPVDASRYTRTARVGSTTVSGAGDPGAVYREFGDGATIVFQGLQRSWPPLTRFCRDLELELTHPVQANAYVTPPGARGLGVHYDTHDVFVLQLAGGKEWSVYDPVLENPLPSQPWSAGQAVPGDALLSVELRPGDCLYVPRGFLHSAQAREGASAHVTIGVLTRTWHDAIRDLLTAASDEADFRRPLPVGFARDEAALASGIAEHLVQFRHWLEKVDVDALAARLAREFWSNRPPILRGQLGELLALDRLSDASTVRVRAGAVCRIRAGAGTMTVLLGDREMTMPAALEPAMTRIATGGPFRVDELADQLDAGSRHVLVRRLISEGLLEVVDVG